MNAERYDVVVIGAGSGGIGAALSAARSGLSVLLVEKADTIGGTAVRAGVHVWEPCAGATGLPFDIYKRLKQMPGSMGIYSYGRFRAWQENHEGPRFPGGEHVIDPTQRYVNTLQKHGRKTVTEDETFSRQHFHGVVFEPDVYVRTVESMLAETRRCLLRKNTTFTDVTLQLGAVADVTLDDGARVFANVFIDSTGDGVFCDACGCESMIGVESREMFAEPDAPETPHNGINGVSLIYRVTRTDEAAVQPLPDGIPEHCWWRNDFPDASVSLYPCGDRNVNMLPTMDGHEFLNLSRKEAYAECRRRVFAHWRYMQEAFPEFQRFRLSWVAEMLGIRESRRIVSEYILTENDVLAGLGGQDHPDIVAITDHALDRHGAGAGYLGLDGPYGIPYRCLIPKGLTNVAIACRAAGFSSLAASSCRLSRTIMQLGQAAGNAAYISRKLGVSLISVPADVLREALRDQHVQLEWPMPAGLFAYLREDE